jgi:hypothetical protein
MRAKLLLGLYPAFRFSNLTVMLMLLLPLGGWKPLDSDTPKSQTYSQSGNVMPGIGAAQHIAGVAPANSGIPGHFNIICEIVIRNTGGDTLTNFQIIQPLASPSLLGSTFVNINDLPQFIANGTHGQSTTATLTPSTNPAYNGSGDMLAGGGMLLPGETMVLRYRAEVNPQAAGAPILPQLQATVLAEAPDGMGGFLPVSDLTDAGFSPIGNNSNWPGNTGSGDDPTPLTNCWNLVSGGLACNNLVQVSFNQDCIAAIAPEMILDGEFAICTGDNLLPLGGYYRVLMVTTLAGDLVPDLDPSTPSVYEVSGSYIDQTLEVKVGEIIQNNFCWGNILLEDKLKPAIDCASPLTVLCNQDPDDVPPPTVSDNCDAQPSLGLVSSVILDNNICDDGLFVIRRTYVAEDASGNLSDLCVQDLHLTRPSIDFPDDINWTCSQFNSHPAITNATPLSGLITDSQPATPAIDVLPSLPASVLAATGSGIVNIAGAGPCNYNVFSNDEVITACGNTFQIIRTWTVLDWCNGNFVTVGTGGEDNVQVIQIVDNTPPVITLPGFSVGTTSPATATQPCRSQGFLPPPTVSDDCHAVTILILTPLGQAVYANGGNGADGGFIPAPGLPVGNHVISYIVTDACGNSSTLPVTITVVDDIGPTPVCDELTDVNLNSNGNAEVLALTFDDGSTDNCCVHHFEVRRVTDPCNDGHDDTLFGPSVRFCCEDSGNGPVQVVLRVFDCYGQFNDCTVDVTVHDQVAPQLSGCPATVTVSSDFYLSQLADSLDVLQGDPAAQNNFLNSFFGMPSFQDNCGFSEVPTFNANLDTACWSGTLTRTWRAVDAAGLLSSPCTQQIIVEHLSDWGVTFPADTTISCGTALPELGPDDTFDALSEHIAFSFQDQLFQMVDPSGPCYKIERTWTAINWCVVGNLVDQEVVESSERDFQLAFPGLDCDFDQDGDCDSLTYRDSWRVSPLDTPGFSVASQVIGPDTDPDHNPWDGYIQHVQTIYVYDTIPPVFTGCAPDTFCIDPISCTADISLQMPAFSECDAWVDTSAVGELGTGFGPFTSVAPGSYAVTYTIDDLCGHSTTCATSVVVINCQAPIAACRDTFYLEMDFGGPGFPPAANLSVDSLDNGSTDNCSGGVTLSFLPDSTVTVLTFDCADLGVLNQALWVTNAEGIQASCLSTLFVQASMDQCPDDPLVAFVGGSLKQEDDTPASDATVQLSGQLSATTLSAVDGMFAFPYLPLGSDLTITPSDDEDPLQGVTTYDLVLIGRHILNIAPLDSPYKLIAADANNSGSVTTLDMVEIRKLILHINESFPNNTSWRFVAKDYVFPDPTNPWMYAFPEVINVNDLPGNLPDADFVAIKVGDVNNSASLLDDAVESRHQLHPWVLQATDEILSAGDVFTVSFGTSDTDIEAFQLTLRFDPRHLSFEDVVPALADAQHVGLRYVSEGAILLSWHRDRLAPTVGEPLFRLSFRARSEGAVLDHLSLSDRYVRCEAYRPDGKAVPVRLAWESADATDPLNTRLQCVPNPFATRSSLELFLPTDSQLELTITDISGREIARYRLSRPAGFHAIELEGSVFPDSGIYLCSLTTDTGVRRTIKLVRS